MEAEAEAGTGGGRDAEALGDAPDIIDAEDAEDVVNADGDLHVGSALEHFRLGVGGEGEEFGMEPGAVGPGETAPPPAEGEHLAEFQLFQQGDVIEDGAACLVGYEPFGISVGDELHRVHQGECLGMYDI